MDINLFLKLAEPFPAEVVSAKPQVVSGNRALAVFYIDARDVADRLDQVVGPENWQDSYELLSDGSVACRLSVRVPGGDWVTKMDVGSPAGVDAGDRMKGAFSDSFKRAGVKFGIGRYLYHIPAGWHDYDPQKKQFVKHPTPPPNFLPQKKTMGKEKAREVEELARQAGIEVEALLDYCKTKTLEEAPLQRYDPLKARLLERIREKSKAKP
ncbi:MAG TPA: Rad52/Rad22 family DNA repair protein [Gemmatimonadales bacterium]|nr:Rad52/Rad22 family DNA repair protein [Gemmatimonadales bacterium]